MKRMSVAGTRLITMAVIAIVATALTARGQVEEELSISDGDLPTFPNVLIILDTSGSMADVPYRTEKGEPVPVGTKHWNQDILVGENGEPQYDSDGNLRWTTVDRSDDPFAAGAEGDTFLTGGNHPASKLYKAKLALKKALSDEVDNVNLGFATFLQTRVPRVKALYFRKQGQTDENMKYEFRWLITPGVWDASSAHGDWGAIDLATGTVEPRTVWPDTTPDDVYDDNARFPDDQLSKHDSDPEIHCAPIPLNDKDFPQRPHTDSIGGAKWELVTGTMKNVPLEDGTLVTAYETQFDYSLIYYPPVFDESGDESDHLLPCWSYTSMTRTGIGFAPDMSWVNPNPFYPVEAEDPALNNLGNECIPDSKPPKPELISFFR